MKKYSRFVYFTITLPLLILAIIAANASYGQSCGLDIFEEGKSIYIETKIWPGILESYPQYLRAKEKKKPAIQEAYLADIESGKLQPTNTKSTMIISKAMKDETGQLVEFSIDAYGKTYTSQTLCTDDSMYLARNKYPIIQEYDGKILGVAIQGVKVLPLKIEVGDFLLPYDDVGMSPRTSETFTMQEEVLTGIKTTTSIKYGSFHDSEDYKLKYGTYKSTETKYVYETVDVSVKKQAQLFMFAINYAYAVVSGKEEIEFNGKMYEAFIIDSEAWGKGMNQIEYESSSAKVVKDLKKMDKKVERSLEKFSSKAGMTNEEGYIVSASREWYIPGIGVVQTATYDMFGNFQSITTVTSIK